MPVTQVTHDLDALTLVIEADFAAPVERIWGIYADPRQLETIWGPPEFPATFVDHDLSAGGRCTYYMTTPDGQKHCGYWLITSVDEPKRFEFEDGFADQDFQAIAEMPVSVNIFSFEPSENGTHATYYSRYASREALQQVLDMGVIEGASAAINQIDGHIA